MPQITHIRKRDGRIVAFDQDKIASAIYRAFEEAGRPSEPLSTELAEKVTTRLEVEFAGQIPKVEQIQDIVEETLKKEGYGKIEKLYHLYRDKRTKLRNKKHFLTWKKLRVKLSANAVKVLESRYLLRNERGKIIETPEDLLRRVAHNVALAERVFDPNLTLDDFQKFEEDYYGMMARLEFLPNSPTLFNAGTESGQLSACFVLPIEDSLESIYETLKHTALIHKTGGGTGFNFSHLRPRGDVVRKTSGIASGPVSFLRMYDTSTEIIKQGGKRRGANMGILNFDHPDIMEFITSKTESEALRNFNISVGVTDEFMEKAKRGENYDLINPRTKQKVGQYNAQEVFDRICTNAWQGGDPGMIFLDKINNEKGNPIPSFGRIEATNPCGEVPLFAYESCNLGSIDLACHTKKDGKINWDRLRKTTKLATRFLDNVVEMSRYPIREIEEMTKSLRRVGLGVMGFASMLIKLGIPYDSEEAVKTAREVMKFIQKAAEETSRELAEKRGVFPHWDISLFKEQSDKRRNLALTTIAPTGTIGIIAGTSSGIEPLFALVYLRHAYIGERPEEPVELLEVSPLFEETAKREGFYSEKLMKKVVEEGSVQNIAEVPQKYKEIFKTAHDISPEQHLRIQAAFQEFTDNAVSKTINLPESSPPEDIKKIYMQAYELGLKGITVFRSGSKKFQILEAGREAKEEISLELLNPEPSLPEIPPGSCPTCG